PGRDHLPYLTPYPHGRGQTWFNRSGNGITAWINRMMYSASTRDIRLSLTSLPTSSICSFVSLRKNSTGIPMRRSLSITTSSIKLWTTMGSRSTSGRRSGKSTRLRSSEIPDENSEEHFVGTSEDWTIGKSIEISQGSSPSVYSEELSDELVVLVVSSKIRFLGIQEITRKNEFPRSYFRGLVSSVCRRNNVIPTTYRRFFFSVCRCFLVVFP
uniref:Uncharacterized protein n=1 Tax=Brassica oleracea var. oleracea TaxID=109376 RepID=A0A0D3DN10_BRAOL